MLRNFKPREHDVRPPVLGVRLSRHHCLHGFLTAIILHLETRCMPRFGGQA